MQRVQLEIGKIYDGKVKNLAKFGAFVEIPEANAIGMVHISEVSDSFVKEISDVLQDNQAVKVKVLGINENGKVSLSIKQAMPRTEQRPERAPRQRTQNPHSAPAEPQTFEDMLTNFKKRSDERMVDIKRNTDSKRRSSGRRK